MVMGGRVPIRDTRTGSVAGFGRSGQPTMQPIGRQPSMGTQARLQAVQRQSGSPTPTQADFRQFDQGVASQRNQAEMDRTAGRRRVEESRNQILADLGALFEAERSPSERAVIDRLMGQMDGAAGMPFGDELRDALFSQQADAATAGLGAQEEMLRQRAAASGLGTAATAGARQRLMANRQRSLAGSARDLAIRQQLANMGAQDAASRQLAAMESDRARRRDAALLARIGFLQGDQFSEVDPFTSLMEFDTPDVATDAIFA